MRLGPTDGNVSPNCMNECSDNGAFWRHLSEKYARIQRTKTSRKTHAFDCWVLLPTNDALSTSRCKKKTPWFYIEWSNLFNWLSRGLTIHPYRDDEQIGQVFTTQSDPPDAGFNPTQPNPVYIKVVQTQPNQRKKNKISHTRPKDDRPDPRFNPSDGPSAHHW